MLDAFFPDPTNNTCVCVCLCISLRNLSFFLGKVFQLAQQELQLVWSYLFIPVTNVTERRLLQAKDQF